MLSGQYLRCMGEDSDASSESNSDSGSSGDGKNADREQLAAGKSKVDTQRHNAKSTGQTDSGSKNPKVEKSGGKDQQDGGGPPSAEGQTYATSVTSNAPKSSSGSSDGDSGGDSGGDSSSSDNS